MKSKFEEFNDGIARLYSVNDDEKLVPKMKEEIRFGEENVSIQRHYAAQSADRQVDRMIHVLYSPIFDAHDVIVIEEEQFDVEKVDNLKKNFPPISKLTLIKLEKHRKKEFA